MAKPQLCQETEGTGLPSSYSDLLWMKEQARLETAGTKPHAGLRSRALDTQLFQKHLDLLCWSEVRDSTEPFTGSAGLETQLSFHTEGRHTEGLVLHTSTPHNSHLPVNGAPLPANIRFAVLSKVPTS